MKEFFENFVADNHPRMIEFMSNADRLNEWENMNLRLGSSQGVGYEARVQLEEFVNKVQKKLNFNVESIEVKTGECPLNAVFQVTCPGGLTFDLSIRTMCTRLEVGFSHTTAQPIFRHVARYKRVHLNGSPVRIHSEKQIKELATGKEVN